LVTDVFEFIVLTSFLDQRSKVKVTADNDLKRDEHDIFVNT